MEEKTNSVQNINSFGAKGWFLILYSLLALFVNVSMTIDGLNVALPLVTENNQLDYDICLSLGTVAGFVGIVLMFVIGKIREKVGSRLTSGVLLIIAGVVYCLMYLNSSSIVMYGAAMSILVAATQSCVYLCTGALQAQWFPRKRGVAVGISTTGANIGSAILVPLMTATTTLPNIVKPRIIHRSAFQSPRAMSTANKAMGKRFRSTMLRPKPAVNPPTSAPRGMVTIPARTPWAKNFRSSAGRIPSATGTENTMVAPSMEPTMTPPKSPAFLSSASSRERGAPPMSLARMEPGNIPGSAPRNR